MLKAVFDIFEPTEKQLTKSAILRVRWTAVLGLFVLPTFAAIELLPITGDMRVAAITLGLALGAALLYCLSTRMANRLWVPEKYLDESEIEIKRRSASLAYQFLVLALAAVLLLLTLPTVETAMLVTPRAITFSLGSIFIGIICIQTIFATFMMKPLSDGSVDVTPMDKRYGFIMGLVLIALFGLSYLVGSLS